jgi:hypothetical protein
MAELHRCPGPWYEPLRAWSPPESSTRAAMLGLTMICRLPGLIPEPQDRRDFQEVIVTAKRAIAPFYDISAWDLPR